MNKQMFVFASLKIPEGTRQPMKKLGNLWQGWAPGSGCKDLLASFF